MYIRKNIKKEKGKVYTSHALVESVRTPKGPRQKLVCALGDLRPRPREKWLKLAHKVENALVGQGDLFDKLDVKIGVIVRKVRERRAKEKRTAKKASQKPDQEDDLVAIKRTLLDRGIHTSWATVRDILQTHQVSTIVLPTHKGMVLKIRKASTPQPQHVRLYELLSVPRRIIRPKKASPQAPECTD